MVLFDPELCHVDELPPPSWPDTIWQLAWLVPLTAITVKRFNDRDWPSWAAYAFVMLYASCVLRPAIRIAISTRALPAPAAQRSGFSRSSQLLVLIDNGFLRGTDGPNRHGPDPLPGAHAA